MCQKDFTNKKDVEELIIKSINELRKDFYGSIRINDALDSIECHMLDKYVENPEHKKCFWSCKNPDEIE